MVDMAMVTLGCDPGSTDTSPQLPLYEQLAELLREKIRTGELKPGDRLPSTGMLKADGWKQNVIVSAMRILRVEGWTRGQPGQAVFVVDQPPAGPPVGGE